MVRCSGGGTCHQAGPTPASAPYAYMWPSALCWLSLQTLALQSLLLLGQGDPQCIGHGSMPGPLPNKGVMGPTGKRQVTLKRKEQGELKSPWPQKLHGVKPT